MKTTVKYLCFLAIFCMSTSTFAGELSVIVNTKNKVETLTTAQVREHYLQIRPWALGRKVRPIDNEGNDELRNTFLEKVLRFNSMEVARYWIEQQYSRALKPPVSMSSDKEVVAYVLKHRGGIGVVESSSVGDEVKTVLTISY